MKKITLIIITLFTIHDLLAQQLVEEVVKSDNFYDIPFTKYKLDNGLTIILHQDTTVSNVYINMLYKVGSVNEVTGKTGYAHLFEHLMFAGTKTLSKKDIWNLFPNTKSSYMNASTSEAYTIYEEEVPADYLETALWFESQRLQFTPAYINEKNVAVQKEVVLNEMAMRQSESNIYNQLNDTLYENSNPLHHPVIGYKDDIENATLESIIDFFIRWYVPNNAILTITGNINIQNTLTLIDKHFAGISKGILPVANENIKDGKLNATVGKEIQSDIYLPEYYFKFPTVRTTHEDEAPLDALAYVMKQRDNPMKLDDIKINLYNSGIGINVEHPCSFFDGSFQVYFRTEKSLSIKKAASLLSNTFKSFKNEGFIQENIDEFKQNFKYNSYNRISTIRSVGYSLVMDEFYSGSPNASSIRWNNNLSVNKEKIKTVFEKYLYNKPFVQVNVLPFSQKQKKQRLVKENYHSEFETDIIWNDNEIPDTTKKITLPDFVKKSVPQKTTPFVFWKTTLGNQIKVYGTKNLNTPLSSLQINIKAGLLYNKPKFAGMSGLYIAMLNNIIEYNYMRNSLKSIGAKLSFDVNKEDINMYLSFPQDEIKRAVILLDSVLFYANIQSNSFYQYIQYYHKFIKDNIKLNDFLSTQTMLNKSFYAPGSINNYSVYGSEKTINKITADDFDLENKQLFQTNINIFYVGNLEKDSLIKTISNFKIWKTDTLKKITAITTTIQPENINILLNDKIDATQSVIDIGIKTVTNKSVNNYTMLQLVNYILGETFTSRMPSKIREEKGLAYYCYSYIPNSLYDDILHIKTNINIEKTDTGIVMLIKELNNFIENGVTQEELDNAKISLLYRINEIPQTIYAKLDYLEKISSINQPSVFANKQTQLIKYIDVIHLNQFIKDYFKPNTYQIAIVSDKLKVLPQLQKLNYKITDYTDKLY